MISQVFFQNFVHFHEFRYENISNLNIIIGENDTGKTSLLKMMYATAKAWEEFSLREAGNSEKIPFKKIFSTKLKDTFQPENGKLGEMVTKKRDSKLKAEITFFDESKDKQHIYFSFSKDAESNIHDCSEIIKPFPDSDFRALFIPAKEVLTAFKAITAISEKYFMYGFDATYTDLIKSLQIVTRKGNIAQKLVKVNEKLEGLFGGEITQTNEGEFIFRKKNSKSEFGMSLTAEGVKKLGILSTLIRNRELHKGTILFMDEPEAVLHPKAIKELAQILYLLSQNGIQVFLSTHSFFVIKELELIARKEKSTISCCSLEQTPSGVTATFNDLQYGLPVNPIVDTAMEMFNQEVALAFSK